MNILFLFCYFIFYNNPEEEAIKFKRTPVRLEIVNHIFIYLNINISEEVNVKARKSLLVAHHFLYNYVFSCKSRKYTNSLCGKVVS